MVVDLHLDPVHQVADVLLSWERSGLFVFVAVGPQVLETGTSRHRGARLRGAVVRYGAIYQIDAVKKVHH